MNMVCIQTWPKTNVFFGRIYVCTGRFVCGHCGRVSEILRFRSPVRRFSSIYCSPPKFGGCGRLNPLPGRYTHQKRFIPLLPNGTKYDMHTEPAWNEPPWTPMTAGDILDLT